jgi:hypothetical protein
VSCKCRTGIFLQAKALEKNTADSNSNCHIVCKRRIFDLIHSIEFQKKIQSTFERVLVKEPCGEFLASEVFVGS